EDGIRDFHVTGVQTCALPILSDTPPLVSPDGAGATDPSSTPVSRSRLPRTSTAPQQQQQYQILSRPSLQSATSAPPVPITSGGRSEERRVGKEWRSRGAGEVR